MTINTETGISLSNKDADVKHVIISQYIQLQSAKLEEALVSIVQQAKYNQPWIEIS